MTLNVCIIGASGVGKTEFSKLFRKDKVTTIEPYRARKDGARINEKYFVNPDMLTELLLLNRTTDPNPVVYLDSDIGNVAPYTIGNKSYRKWLEVYKRASFFMVRDTAQVLLHHPEDEVKDRRLEIFAPVLSLILNSRAAARIIPYFQGAVTVFVLLNPLDQSVLKTDSTRITEYSFSDGEWSWERIQKERNFATKGEAKSEDIRKRLDALPIEASAWQSLAQLAKDDPDAFKFVDCKQWRYFECECLAGKYGLLDMREYFLECVKEQGHEIYDDLVKLLLTEQEIKEMQ